MRSLFRVLLVLLACAGPAAGAQSARPAVLVIGTGGTIGSAGDYWTGNPTRVPIDQLGNWAFEHLACINQSRAEFDARHDPA